MTPQATLNPGQLRGRLLDERRAVAFNVDAMKSVLTSNKYQLGDNSRKQYERRLATLEAELHKIDEEIRRLAPFEPVRRAANDDMPDRRGSHAALGFAAKS